MEKIESILNKTKTKKNYNYLNGRIYKLQNFVLIKLLVAVLNSSMTNFFYSPFGFVKSSLLRDIYLLEMLTNLTKGTSGIRIYVVYQRKTRNLKTKQLHKNNLKE